MRRPLDGHLPFLHRLQQCGLGLRRGAIDLIGEEEVREDRPRAKHEVTAALVVDKRARDVGGHQVGGELDALEIEPRHRGERARHQRLGQARNVFDQHVAIGEDRHQDQGEHITLADDCPLYFADDPVGQSGDLFKREGLHRAPQLLHRRAHRRDRCLLHAVPFRD